MRRIVPVALLAVLAACASAPPDTTAIIPFVSLDSVIVSPISREASRIDQLVLSDSVLAMVSRRESCVGVDEALRQWAEGANAFNGALELGVQAERAGATSRVLHSVADAGVIGFAAATGYFVLNQLNKTDRDFSSAKISLGAGAVLKLFDAAFWKPEADDSRLAFDAARKIAELRPAATNLPERILALRGYCRDAAFEGRARDLRSYQLSLVSDFIGYVDQIPSRYIPQNRTLFSYRQRLRWYEQRTDFAQ